MLTNLLLNICMLLDPFEDFDDMFDDFKAIFITIFVIVALVIISTIIYTIIKFNKTKKSSNDFFNKVKNKIDKTIEQEKTKNICPYCGTHLKDDETKCPSCGARRQN